MLKNNLFSPAIHWDIDVAQSEKGLPFFHNTIVRVLLGANTLFLCASFGVLGYFLRPTESLLILHYNVYFGVEIQGVWWQAFILPLAGVAVALIHTLFARNLYRTSERIAAYLMLFGSGLLSSGILIAVASMAFINY